MKIEDKIKKYAELRGFNNIGITYETLLQAYNRVSDIEKLKYEKEMDQYLKAIEEGKIQKGQSILHLAHYEGNTNQDNKSH